MVRRWCVLLGCLLAMGWSLTSRADDEIDELAKPRRPVVPPLLDDAALHDVQFQGTRTGWAVGDHGVIWNTTDSGSTWQLQTSGVNCALRSACFLTNKLGWIAGGESIPYAHQGVGVILTTTDGGGTWQRIGGNDLPELQRIKFFTQTHGIAAGEPNSQCSSGIIVTQDGGKTWKPVTGDSAGNWRAADFLSPELGAVAGLRGRHSLFGGGRLVKSKLGDFGLRGLYGLKLLTGGEGWLVGDGGLILHQNRGGVVWESPAQTPPREVRDLFDFRAVAVRGTKVWVAGEPGSVVWHSPDAGETWTAGLTRQTLPISALHFTSDETGWAVGALGTILQTTDGGESWLPARAGDRRLAFVAVHGQIDRVSVPMLTAVAGEAGYRGLVSVVPRQDGGPASPGTREIDLKLAEAVMLAGGSASSIGWRLPVDIPGLEQNAERLIAEWTKRSEGEVRNQLVAQAVRQLRTWRPSVVIIDEPGPHDALARLIRDIYLEAVPAAADPAALPEQLDLAGLPTWEVARIFVRLPEGSSGQVNVGSFDLLPRRGCAVQVAAAPALACLRSEAIATGSRETYRIMTLDGKPGEYKGYDFFAKLGINPGTEARRSLPPIEDQDQARKLKLANQQRNFHEYLKKCLTDSRLGSQLIAQLADVTRGMPDDQAALLLAQLADAYRRQGQWDLAEATLVQMVEQYPHEPAAQDGMRWLIQLWVGTELTYHRLKSTNMERKQLRVDVDDVAARIRNAGRRFATSEGTVGQEIEQLSGENPALQVEQLPFNVRTGQDKDLRQQHAELWQDKARRMATFLQRAAPAWYHSPDIQFPLAALYRQRQRSTESNECYHFIMRGGDQTPWQKSAATELWLAQMAGVPPKSIYGCRPVSQAPVLDGLLTDECWQQAGEMRLLTDQADGPLKNEAFVLMCHDDEFLYFAGVCPRVPGTPTTLPNPKGRTFDADLAANDRVTLLLDVDRDYTTYYRFTIDQRGWTNDDLWGDLTWNPKWYVSADGDELGWRFEVAIPWKELVPQAPVRDTMWVASVVRTVPAHGLQSWTTPVTGKPKLETGGVLKIE